MSTNAETILKRYITHVMPAVQEMISMDNCMVAVADLQKFIYYKRANTFDIGDITGLALPPEDTMYQSITSGKTVSVYVPAEVFGTRFRSTCSPIKDDSGKIIGGFGIGFSMTNIDSLSDISQNLLSSTEELSATSEEIANSANNLSTSMESLKSSSLEVSQRISQTDDILEFINSIADSTNLLGLNAAIESARAGEHGLGFSVVAQEIRKLSSSSTDSVKEISQILNSIKQFSEQMLEQINDLAKFTQHQKAATSEMSNALSGLTDSAEDIIEISKHV